MGKAEWNIWRFWNGTRFKKYILDHQSHSGVLLPWTSSQELQGKSLPNLEQGRVGVDECNRKLDLAPKIAKVNIIIS